MRFLWVLVGLFLCFPSDGWKFLNDRLADSVQKCQFVATVFSFRGLLAFVKECYLGSIPAIWSSFSPHIWNL